MLDKTTEGELRQGHAWQTHTSLLDLSHGKSLLICPWAQNWVLEGVLGGTHFSINKKNGLVLAISNQFLLWLATGIYMRNTSFSARALLGALARRPALVATWMVKHQGTKGQASPGHILAMSPFHFVSGVRLYWNWDCTPQPVMKCWPCQCWWWGRWEGAERTRRRRKVHKMQTCRCET